MIAVLVPVLDRPKNAMPLAASLRATTKDRLVFLVSPGDRREIRACRNAAAAWADVEVIQVPFRHAPGDYARKINYGVEATEEPWLFQAGDDLAFHPEWAEKALQAHLDTGARVVGTNDLGNPRVVRGRHATHSLVARTYVAENGTIDGDGMLYEGYAHNFCDDELVATARYRREFVFARDSRVEHLHPNWRKAQEDSTYRRGMADFDADRRLHQSRASMWRPGRRRVGR